MRIDLRVPAGTVLMLRRGEWYTPGGDPATEDVLINVVAVGQEMSAGLVSAHGHDCNHHRPDCGRDHCWEGRVLVSAVRAEMGQP
ncbi:hypothetical protein GCM10011608_10160 [Micromonospora sonchi]|uniref:Uncharacterized protein n=1 Tax=Micromonospora sonchi TaxID=1763543 RepID=A0A917TL87_9ACTN|nr:hypothetical protein [Micromonospora sonchi]GGM27377.1 hypothetical protein GCM10011608_10160 [Micromonospora sonchi]